MVSGSSPSDLVSALLAAPLGVALLGRLEGDRGERDGWGHTNDAPACTDPDAVRQAVEELTDLTLGAFLALAVECGVSLAGPWMAESPRAIALGYRFAEQRRPIAEAIVSRFGDELGAPVGRDSQQVWLSGEREDHVVSPAFVDFGDVYGNGEFTSAGVFTVTDPPAEAHRALVSAWEMYPPPTSRWRVPIRAAARVFEIHRPADWQRLVEAYPKAAKGPHWDWELPGPNQRRSHIAPLLDVQGRHAVRTSVTRHVLPDWRSVAEDYDGVHLSWAGYLTAEGFLSDLHEGGVTMLRYWFSERSLWLRNVFEDPVPLPAPALYGNSDGDVGVGVTKNAARRESDLRRLATRLGRSGPGVPDILTGWG